jgi:hypothetical protein
MFPHNRKNTVVFSSAVGSFGVTPFDADGDSAPAKTCQPVKKAAKASATTKKPSKTGTDAMISLIFLADIESCCIYRLAVFKKEG